MINVTLPNGEVVDNYSQEYRLFCEAKWLSNKDFSFRKEWLFKIKEKRNLELLQLEKYLNLILSLKKVENKPVSDIIMP